MLQLGWGQAHSWSFYPTGSRDRSCFSVFFTSTHYIISFIYIILYNHVFSPIATGCAHLISRCHGMLPYLAARVQHMLTLLSQLLHIATWNTSDWDGELLELLDVRVRGSHRSRKLLRFVCCVLFESTKVLLQLITKWGRNDEEYFISKYPPIDAKCGPLDTNQTFFALNIKYVMIPLSPII